MVNASAGLSASSGKGETGKHRKPACHLYE
jgi:hypothetical protein